MVKKPLILYIDDKKKWIDAFKQHHAEEFEIDAYSDVTSFRKRLAELKESTEKHPDIILIDLFHPRHDDPEVQKETEVAGAAAIKKLEDTIEEVKTPIYTAWDAYGFDLLESARKLYPDTPIAIYTQQGLSVVENRELIRVAASRGEWLLKGRDGIYESNRLNNMLERAHDLESANSEIRRLKAESKRVYNRVLIFSAIFVVIGILYYWAVNTNMNEFLKSLVIPLLMAFVPIIITSIEKVKSKRKE